MRVEELPLRTLCGQLLVGGFVGEAPPAPFVEAVRRGERAGAILFKRNLPEALHTLRVSEALTAAAPPDLPLYVAIDQEGGRVERLKAPVLSLPPMRTLADRGDLALLHDAGEVLGAQLAALGCNLDFAPVLDVDTNPDNPIIGDRAFSREPGEAAERALAFHAGLSAHVLGCGKHFPGHGDTSVDSHLALPSIEHPRERLDRVELLPFVRAIEAGVHALMTAHVVTWALDGSVPATLSRRVSTELLRDELGFRGVLFSDDLEMKAVADLFAIEESSVRAVEAGCDVLLVCKEEDWQERALAALVDRCERDLAFRARCREAVSRSLAARRGCPPRGSREAFDRTLPRAEALRARIEDA